MQHIHLQNQTSPPLWSHLPKQISLSFPSVPIIFFVPHSRLISISFHNSLFTHLSFPLKTFQSSNQDFISLYLFHHPLNVLGWIKAEMNYWGVFFPNYLKYFIIHPLNDLRSQSKHASNPVNFNTHSKTVLYIQYFYQENLFKNAIKETDFLNESVKQIMIADYSYR